MGTATPVVLLHGMRVTSTMWHPVRDQLARHRPVACPDLPGHGSRRDVPFSTDQALRTVRAAVDELGGRAVLVGHSLGGFLATAAAARHPDAVRGLVAIGCTTVPRGAGLAAYRAYGRFLAGHPARAERVGTRGFRSQLPPEVYESVAAGGFDGTAAPDVVSAVAALDPLGDLGAYPGPVWLLNGGWDQFRGQEQRFLDACRQGRLTVWPGLTHVSVIGHTDRLVRFIQDACVVVDHDGAPY